jgi:hypothetical protein
MQFVSKRVRRSAPTMVWPMQTQKTSLGFTGLSLVNQRASLKCIDGPFHSCREPLMTEKTTDRRVKKLTT